MAEVLQEFEGKLGVANVEKSSVKRMLLAMINGGNVERMARETLGGWVVGGALDQLRREVAKVRARVMEWRPDIAEDVRRRNPGEPEWRLRVKATYYLMTEGEDEVLRVIEEVAEKSGLSGDAPTGDGLLVRLGRNGSVEPVAQVIRRMQEEVRRQTGIPMQIRLKSVGGSLLSS